MTTAPFGPEEAAHLLSRLQFGVRPEEVERAVEEGRSATLQRLLTWQPESPDFETASSALQSTALATGQLADLQTWWHFRLFATANPVREKLTLHWHNHFATSFAKVKSVPYLATQNELLREHAAGSFAELLPAVARDPAMLIWLDGQANRKRHPNENFAREVMELFCLGVGHYSEADIREAARAFSGWQLREGRFWVNESQHDVGEKTIFGRVGNWSGDDVLQFCLEHPACPRWLAKKLLRSFVTDTPSPEQIERVAVAYRQHRLQTIPVLRELCESDEFYGPTARGQLIKSPLEFVIGTLRSVGAQPAWSQVRTVLNELGQSVFEPPSVKGWEGGRLWIQSSSWIQRWNFLEKLFNDSRQLAESGPHLQRLCSDHSWPICLFGGLLEPGIAAELRAANELRAATLSTDGQNAAEPSRQFLQMAMSLPEYQRL